MKSNLSLRHPIQREIIEYLTHHEYATFSELRPKKTETNLVSYHIKLLVTSAFITKVDSTYTLGPRGLEYLEQVEYGDAPQVAVMLLIQEGYGKVLVQKRTRQPNITTWSLPQVTMTRSDNSVLAAARQASLDKLSFDPHALRHVGDCYVRVNYGDIMMSSTLNHIIRFETDGIRATDELMWVEPLDLMKLPVAPGVEQIVTRAFFGDDFFFEEFVVTR